MLSASSSSMRSNKTRRRWPDNSRAGPVEHGARTHAPTHIWAVRSQFGLGARETGVLVLVGSSLVATSGADGGWLLSLLPVLVKQRRPRVGELLPLFGA